tara:strand:+ start:357 stop:590 length:234 start_codon:yes stop_codon:yes gene_type:complete
MKFYEIKDDDKVVPGEYVLHVPTKTIVLCGAFDGKQIRALSGGALVEDVIENFKKIQITEHERRTNKYVASCKSCGG